MKKLANFVFIILISCSCSQNERKKNSLKENHPKVNSTVIDKIINDSIELELSDISENLQLIKLETSKSVLPGNIYTIVLVEKSFMSISLESFLFRQNINGKLLNEIVLGIAKGFGPFLLTGKFK